MKAKGLQFRSVALASSVLACCALNLHAQNVPAIATEPISETVLPGESVTFSVVPEGDGPFSYQWQFNGADIPNNQITTVAGTGRAAYEGDGGAATNASFSSPYDVAFDAWGNLYVADPGNNRVRKIDTGGIITTVAGNGSAAYAGDGGAATNACLFSPYGVALDAAGNLYIADADNNRVRKVDTHGIITTVAGNGSAAYAGDGGAATNCSLNSPSGLTLDAEGNLYIADRRNQRFRKVDTNGVITTVAGKGGTGYGGDGGFATNASLSSSFGIAVDAADQLYLADFNNNRIRRVDTNGVIATVAGGGSQIFAGDGGWATYASLNHPRHLGLRPDGTLYFVDHLNHRIRKVDTNGVITTVAGNAYQTYAGDGGPATRASLNFPSSLALDAAGNLYIADSSNQCVRVVHFAGTPALTLTNVSPHHAGGYTVVVSSPYGSVTSVVATLTVAAPPIITLQPASRIAAAGSRVTFSASVAGTGPFEYRWSLRETNLLQSDTNGTLTLPAIGLNDAGDYRVVVTNSYGSVTSQVATLTVASPPVATIQPTSQTVLCGSTVNFNIAANGLGPFSYQWQFNGSNLPNNLITTVAGKAGSGFSGDGGAATNANLFFPQGVGFDAAGNLYIADNNNRVRKVDTNGVITTVAGKGGSGSYAGDGGPATNAYLYRPNNVSFDGAGSLFIADIYNHRIRKVDTNGMITTAAGNGIGKFSGDGGAATNASLFFPPNLAVGADSSWYIADLRNHRIRKVDTDGFISTVVGTGNEAYGGDGGLANNASLDRPQGVTVDAAGNLYIADSYNHRIRKVDPHGIISTVAGNGNGTYGGDGGAATNSSLFTPWFVALDGIGQLYIADLGNNRIRKVDTNGIISTVAGDGNGAYGGDGGAAGTASLNGPACVAFDAPGNLYIADWYNNRVREVHLAGDPALTLTNVSAADAGSYTVVVSSPYGSVTSTVATLTVTVPRSAPRILTGNGSFGCVSNQFGFTVGGAVGQTIVVEGSSDLAEWLPLYTNTVLEGPFYFVDPAWTNFPWRFYRARLP